MNLTRKLITTLVTVCLVIVMMIPMVAFADADEDEVAITDIKITIQQPKIGETVKETISVVTTPSEAQATLEIDYVKWYRIPENSWNAGRDTGFKWVREGDVFEEGYVYGCDIRLEASPDVYGYYFTENTTVTINGKAHNNFYDEAYEDERDFYPTVFFEHQADTSRWESDENTHWNPCELQDEKYNEEEHTFEWIVDKEATATTAGSKHEECTVCGYAKAAVEIPATGTDDGTSPKTGDTENAMIWLSLVLASGVALTCTTVLAKKRK